MYMRTNVRIARKGGLGVKTESVGEWFAPFDTKENTLGECLWRSGIKDGVSWSEDNTTISIQKSILGDETTLRRIVAHELCHHEDFLVNVKPEFDRMGFHTYKMYKGIRRDDGHGAPWQAIAARFNAKYGTNFVTKTSDQDMVIDRSVTKPYFVLIQNENGKLGWQQCSRIGDKQKKYLYSVSQGQYPHVYPVKLVKTTNPMFMNGPIIGGYGRVRPGTEEKRVALQELWDTGENLLSQFSTPPPPEKRIQDMTQEELRKKFPRYFRSSLLQKTAAPISDTMKSQIYYHGTGSETAAQSIMKDGIQPREIIVPDKAKSRSQLAPVPDRVYLTTDRSYAAIYALGGQMFGSVKEGDPIPKWLENRLAEGKYGYIFEIHGSQLSGDVVPDEDSIGDALHWLMEDIKDNQRLYELNNGKPERWKGELDSLKRGMEIVSQQRINQSDVPRQVRTELQHLYTYYLTDRQKQNLMEIGTQAQVGKKLQKHLSQATCQWMIENGSHVAHRGAIRPTHCWRFSKEAAVHTKDLNSILEQIPLQKTASPDFGYTKYRNREKDLKKVKFVSQGREGDYFGVAAKFDGKDIGAIECSITVRLATVYNVWIDGTWRGTGLGQLLYDHAIQVAKKIGMDYFSSDDQLTDDAVSAWMRLRKRYPMDEVDNMDYDPDAEFDGSVPQHPVRYRIDLDEVRSLGARL
jgi:GNAT superfamily N-acetyltransferase